MPDTTKIEGALNNNPNSNISATPPKAQPKPPQRTQSTAPVDDGLVAADDDTQDITPPTRRRAPQRDPVQVAAYAREREAIEAKKPDPSPFIDPEIDELPDNDDPAATAEEVAGDEEAGDDVQAEFDEELYARARAVGLTREEITDFQKTDGRLQRMVDRLEDSQAARMPRREAPPKPAEKPEETFDEKAVMEAYGITDKNDPLLRDMRQNFEARQAMQKRLDQMEQRDRDRSREAFVLKLDGDFGSKAMVDKYGDLFGGEQSTEDLGDSREAAAREAVIERAKFDARRDQDLGRKPKSRRQYILEAADSLYGHVIAREKVVREKVTRDADGKLRDRKGLFVKRPDGRKVPEAPETGDDAARKVIREKMGLKPEDANAGRIVEESLLND